MKNVENPQERGMPLRVTRHASLVTLLLLTGCGVTDTVRTQQVFYGDRNYMTGTHYLTFEHAFTDAGEADAKRRAATQCAQRNRAAVKTEGKCTLKSCITSYQCMNSEEAEKYPGDSSKR